MRKLWGLAGLWLLSYSSLAAATIGFSSGVDLADLSSGRIGYQDWPRIQVSATLSLPARQMVIELGPGETISQITVAEMNRGRIGLLPSWIGSLDHPTSLDGRYDELFSACRTDRLGTNSHYFLGEMTSGGKRLARFLLFPITVDSEGQLFQRDSISMSVGGREIAPDRLSPLSTVLGSLGGDFVDYDPRPSSPSGLPDYVIITNAELADAFRPLALYKIQTGYRTSIVLVEDIFAGNSGRDNAERVREYLKGFYAGGGKYVLLGGDETVVPVRYAFHSDADSVVPSSLLQVSDLYYADLTGEWNRDGDSIWGERTSDAPDLSPELLVGRLPVNTPEEVRNYVDKLIRYETNPGNSDLSYLSRVFFFSSDQMRDYSPVTQHGYIAGAFPNWLVIDTTDGVEMSSGGDIAPTNLAPIDLGPVLSQGYGIINILAHGRDDGFAVTTSGYNTGSRGMLWTNAPSGESNTFASVQAPDRPAFYYSLACDNGAFDKSSPPFNYSTRSMVQELIAERDGAVGMVAYSRWGWIGTSYILQRTFFDSLFAHSERPAVQAMYACKARYPYYRDLILGQNYFGDPTLVIYTSAPSRLELQLTRQDNTLTVTASVGGQIQSGTRILISDSSGVVVECITDESGKALLTTGFDRNRRMCISALNAGCTIAQAWYYPSIVTDVDDETQPLPAAFTLAQNYPNPFNPSTQISFSLPIAGHAELTVFDLQGCRVVTLISRFMPAGVHRAEWHGTNREGEAVAAGVYFYRLISGSHTQSRKMMLLK